MFVASSRGSVREIWRVRTRAVICSSVLRGGRSRRARPVPEPTCRVEKNNEGQCNVPKALGRVGTMAAGDTWPVAFAGGRFATWGASPQGSGSFWANLPQDPTLGGGVPRLSVGDALKFVAAGDQRVLAIQAQSRLVFAWGRNSDGEDIVPKNFGPYVSVAAGNRHSVAVRADGQLVCWGSNFENACDTPSGQCGNMPALSDIRQVAASNFFTLAVDNKNRIHAWEQIVVGFPAGFWDGREAQLVGVNNETQAMVTLEGNFIALAVGIRTHRVHATTRSRGTTVRSRNLRLAEDTYLRCDQMDRSTCGLR